MHVEICKKCSGTYYLTSILLNLNTIKPRYYLTPVLFNIKPRYHLTSVLLISPIPGFISGAARRGATAAAVGPGGGGGKLGYLDII